MPKNDHRDRLPGEDGEQEMRDETAAEEDLFDSVNQSILEIPSKRFGLKKETVQRTNPVAANYDYRLKYPEDERYREHVANARVWWVYNDEATAFDNDMIGELGDSLDILLVFAGLFSAVLTTFVVQTSQALSVDDASLSASYLGEISAILRASGNVSTISQIPTTNTSFSPALGDVWVNGLWFTSLTIALSVALFAVLAKQWLRQYMTIITGTPRERAFIRQFRFDGLKVWKVQAIIGILPVLLHLSLMLFLVGLVVFLVPLNTPTAYVTGVITAIILVLYLAASVLPLYIVQCPYRTTFSDVLYYISQLPCVAYQRLRLQWDRYHQQLPTSSSYTGHFQLKALKDVERRAACDVEYCEDLILKALWWLGECSSNVSAKEILLHSLGSFTARMSKKLSSPEALQVLYGFEDYTMLVKYASEASLLDPDQSKLERLFRSMIHFAGSEELDRFKKRSLGRLSFFEPSSWDIELALAFCASDVPMKPIASGNASTIPKPSKGLSWLINNYKSKPDSWHRVEVPSLVWKGLVDASSNEGFKKAFKDELDAFMMSRSAPVPCRMDIEDLIELAEEGKDAPSNMDAVNTSNAPVNALLARDLEDSENRAR
ncbi:hypothetical protein EV361DRAFT_829649 [Lentinula raphanica]|nr:hypothetical protein EV361DRAFT_829649 [Lentinula raphanica]